MSKLISVRFVLSSNIWVVCSLVIFGLSSNIWVVCNIWVVSSITDRCCWTFKKKPSSSACSWYDKLLSFLLHKRILSWDMCILNLKFCIPNFLASFLSSLVFVKGFVRKLIGKISLLKHRWLKRKWLLCVKIPAIWTILFTENQLTQTETKKVQSVSQISIKRHLAMTDLIWYCVLISFLDSTHSLFLLLLFYLHFTFYLFILFYLAVILFRFIGSPLSNVPLQRNQCYHHVIQSHAFSGFQCFPARVASCPDESLLSVGWNVGVVFTFTTVERRLLL